MAIYLGLGMVALALVLLLMRALASVNPAKLAQGSRLLVMIVGAGGLLALALFLALERPTLAVAVIGGLIPLALRAWQEWRRRRPVQTPQGQTSAVETDFLQMSLDHDSGIMTGRVRRGSFQGRDLGDLSRAELTELWNECRSADAQSAKLLEAFLDTAAPGWRESEARKEKPRGSSSVMSREEAYAILGLADGAAEAEIREAYQRLMKKIHPDAGGSSYLAAQINRARDTLLG